MDLQKTASNNSVLLKSKAFSFLTKKRDKSITSLFSPHTLFHLYMAEQAELGLKSRPNQLWASPRFSLDSGLPFSCSENIINLGTVDVYTYQQQVRLSHTLRNLHCNPVIVQLCFRRCHIKKLLWVSSFDLQYSRSSSPSKVSA